MYELIYIVQAAHHYGKITVKQDCSWTFIIIILLLLFFIFIYFFNPLWFGGQNILGKLSVDTRFTDDLAPLRIISSHCTEYVRDAFFYIRAPRATGAQRPSPAGSECSCNRPGHGASTLVIRK